MIHTDVIIVGGGPAGLCAAYSLVKQGISVTLFERNSQLGGQLIKQTHKFFGSEKQYAKTRGFDIAAKLIKDLEPYSAFLTIEKNATVLGIYPEKVVTVMKNEAYFKYQCKAIIVSTGAMEKVLAFEQNDLPGIYGAGAVQTLMNVYGVYPGQSIVMVGSGNIGLIVSYQLLQAGVEVKAVIEAASSIGGYKVHASKLRRLGVPILTNTTIKKAHGVDFLTGVETVQLDESWKTIPGTEKTIKCDACCISVGLAPMHQLLSMAGVHMKYIPEFGGIVPVASDTHETSYDGLFVAGDVYGIEEASSAIVEGYLSGLYVSNKLGLNSEEIKSQIADYHQQLEYLRSGPFGKKTRLGLEKIKEARHVT
jgi:sarcosine oxidase, subunit alpha